MISYNIQQKGFGSDALDDFVKALDPRGRLELNEAGGRGAVVAAIDYHREFDRSGGWRGPNYLGRGTGQGSDFGADVARGWFFKKADAGGAIISNNAEHYAFKVTGGVIRPKRAKALTIPLVAEARGLRAVDYERNTGNELFIPRGKSVLAIKTGRTIRAIYALVRQAVHRPWPNALPPKDVLGDAFVEEFKQALLRHLEGGSK